MATRGPTACLADIFICHAMIGGPALSKAELVGRLLQVLADAGHVPHGDLPAVRQAILRREALGSTGVGRGLAIPHARHLEVPRLLGCLAVCRTPVDFDSLDGEPVDLVALLLTPPDQPGRHLGGASRDPGLLLRRLSDQDFCRRLRHAGSAEEVGAILRAGDGMTRREWDACEDPAVMLRLLRNRGLVGERKALLFAAACSQRVDGRLPGEGREAAEASFLRCLFGPPPFDPVALRPEWLAFEAGIARKLAWGIEAEGDFSRERMGVLADALEDAGADIDLIEHLREPGLHVRGCFAIDALTGQG